jgi:hypothetical protein
MFQRYETSVNCYKTTQCNIPEYIHIHTCHRKILKYYCIKIAQNFQNKCSKIITNLDICFPLSSLFRISHDIIPHVSQYLSLLVAQTFHSCQNTPRDELISNIMKSLTFLSRTVLYPMRISSHLNVTLFFKNA